MQITVSTSANNSPLDFKWLRFIGIRSIVLSRTSPKASLEIKTGDVYGYKPYRKGEFHVIARDLSMLFKVDAATLRSLLNRSNGFKGKIAGKAVENGMPPKTTVKTDTNVPTPKPVKVDRAELKPNEPKDLLVLLRNMNIDGAHNIKYIGCQKDLFETNVSYYFEANAAAKALGAKWETLLETAAMKVIKRDVTIGALEIKFNERLTKAIIICESLK